MRVLNVDFGLSLCKAIVTFGGNRRQCAQHPIAVKAVFFFACRWALIQQLGMNKQFYWILLAAFAVVFVWSGIGPHDLFTWFLEVVPALAGVAILVATYRKFELTRLLYILIFIHCIILMVGGHYTYAEVPLFNWLRDAFDLTRNNYDKVGHFAQGFVPAMIAREVLIRKKVINGKGWRNVFIVSLALAISACYEFIEWWVAELSGESAEAFLGTQGYIWDTQSDMLYATIGAISALVVLSRLHNRQLAALEK